jgi:hypothetical protein
MPNTYTLIQAVTVGSGGAANIAFSSIPSTYTDLSIVASLRSERTTGGTDNLRLEINGSAANFTFRFMYGVGVGVGYSDLGTVNLMGSIPQNAGNENWTANTFTNTSIYIPNYAGSSNKAISVDTTTENNSSSSYTELLASLWSQTTAITSLTLKTGSGSDLTEYSTAYLYGIVKS